MAFDRANLSLLAYANGFKLWHYKSSADAGATIATVDYFLAAIADLSVGDLMVVQASDMTGLVAVNEAAAGVVDVANITNLTASDTA